MKQFAVIGNPISHSLSPNLHEEIFRQLNINASYSRVDILPENLGNFFLKNELDGFNVTIPHKISIMKHLSNLDTTAEKISAVNCVHNNIGYNTDWIGFLHAMNLNNVKLENKDCLIIGAGGAAYATAYALIHCKARSISITNRSEDSRTNLMNWINNQFDNKNGFNPNVIINCTPLGMWPNLNAIPTDQYINESDIAIETIYNPEETTWLKNCKKRGAQTISGLDMFIGQAIASIEIWLNTSIEKKINIKMIKNILKAELCLQE